MSRAQPGQERGVLDNGDCDRRALRLAGAADSDGLPGSALAYFFAAAHSLICTRPSSACLPLPSGVKIVLHRLCWLSSATMDLMIWVVVLVATIVIAAGALALRLRPRHGGPNRPCDSVPASAQDHERQERLRRALTVLRNRPPFADLSDEDITFLAELFKNCRHPQVALGQVVHIAESRRSPRRLQDHDSLRAFVAGARKEGA